ncbi:DUF4442 domain-containing protein [Thalassotalea ganghwensis]
MPILSEVTVFKNAWLMKWLLNIWPPFLFTGIRVVYISKDFREAKVELRMRPWNKNAVGAHFGGSLYAMTDPFYMLLILQQLGNRYFVWDKKADIDYIKPGKGVVSAEFHISEALINDIIHHTADGDKYLPEYPVYVHDSKGELVAKLNRQLYIRKKPKHR